MKPQNATHLQKSTLATKENVISREKIRKNKALIVSELRYRRLFETAQDGVLLIDFKTGMILDVNPFLIQMLGFSKENFLRKHLWEVGVFKNVAASKENFMTLQKKRFVRFEDLPLETKDGRSIDVEFVANAYQVDGTTIIQCNIRDITDRRKAEILLEESESRFRQIFENGQFGIILVDSNNKFIKANPAFCKITGYSEAELLKMKFSDITSPESIKEDVEAAIKLKEGKIHTYVREKQYFRKDRTIVWVKIVVSVIRNPDKSFAHFLTMIEDITARKIAESEFIENNKMFQQVIETNPARIFWKDKKLNYLGCNSLFAKDAGKKAPEELVGHDDYEMGWKDQADLYREDDIGVIKSGKAKLFYEEPQTTPDGNTVWLETSKIPLTDTKDRIVGILGVYTDITSRKKADEKLLLSEKKFSTVFDISPYVITVTRVEDGKFIDVNQAFTSFTGISRKKALSDSSLGLKLWADESARKQTVAELRSKGYVKDKELSFRRADGKVLIGLYSAALMDLGNGPVIVSSIADITKLKETEEKVLELKDRNDAILSSIGDAVFACDKDGNVLIFNEVAEKLTGIPANKVIGKRYSKVITFLREDDEKPVSDFVSEVIKRKDIIRNLNHTLLVSANGKKIPVVNSIAPIKKETGDIVGCVVSFRDVTHEREIDRAKTEFVSLASHQLRTPLTAINWYCEMLLAEESGKLSDKQLNYTKETYKASKRMLKLMDALLNVSRLEMGTFEIEPRPLNFIKLAEACVKELKPQISKKKLVLREMYDPDLGLIKADPRLLNMVFENIIGNAVKYTHPFGKIDLEIRKEEGSVVITVADTGIGIPKDQQDKIFTKLFRADNAKQIDPDGTGLGLYIVKTIMDNCGGKISFETHEGKGSTFRASLPLTGMIRKEGGKKLV